MKFKIPSSAEIAFWMEDGTIWRQRAYVIIYVLLMVSLLVGAMIGRREEPVNISDTKLQTYQAVGDGTVNVALVSKSYNPSKHMMQLEFSAQSSNGLTTLTGNEVSFTGNVVRGNAEISVIPTINNHWTILVTGLQKDFGALEIKTKSNIPVKPSLTSTQVTNAKPEFAITQKHVRVDNKLVKQSIKSVALTAVKTEIVKQENSIKNLKKKISDGKKLITFDQNQIQKLQQNADTLTNSEANNAADTIRNLNQEIAATNGTIDTSNSKIASKIKTISQLTDKQTAIKNGSFDFPAKIETGVIKKSNPSK
ncbi:MAG: hypothetical protein LBT37_06160 [Lactobacillaceae bacterium]|nr:hypothetical protein [Lactobacillaceae bacterium]